MRTVFKSDNGSFSFIAGFLASFSAILNNYDKLKLYLALYLLMKALESIYKTLEEKGYLPSPSIHCHFFFSIPFLMISVWLFVNNYKIMKDVSWYLF